MKYDNYVKKLSTFACKAEDFKYIHNEVTKNDLVDYEPKLDDSLKLSIIIGVHSHADLLSFWRRVPHPKIAIAIPCCVPQITDIDPKGTYIDRLNIGKCNTVKYWDTRDM